MIKFKDVSLALVAHCKAAPDWPKVIYPNQDDDAERPKIIFDHVRVNTTDPTLDGSATRHRGYLMLTVVTKLGIFANTAEGIGDNIAAHFPYPQTRLQVTGGVVSVIKPPEALRGFPDRQAGEYRLPVRIDYLAH